MDQQEYLKKADEIYGIIEKAHDKKINFWFENVLFTWQWWLGLILTIVPWVLWIYFRKKESTYRLLAVGFFVMIICTLLDFVGVTIGLWHYNYDVLPLLPSYLPWDLTLIPVIVISLIQIKPNFNPYIKSLIFSVLSAFVGEPIFVWIKTYSPDKWEYIYSVPILFVIYLIAYFISTRDEYHKVKE